MALGARGRHERRELLEPAAGRPVAALVPGGERAVQVARVEDADRELLGAGRRGPAGAEEERRGQGRPVEASGAHEGPASREGHARARSGRRGGEPRPRGVGRAG